MTEENALQSNNVSEEKEKESQENGEEISTFNINIKTCGIEKTTLNLQVTPMDNIQDIKQYLYELMDTCYVTQYHLYLNGTQLNDFSEIGEIKEIQPDCTLEMKEAHYDERSIRVHVRRLREILLSTEPTSSLSVFSNFQEQEKSVKKGKKKSKKDADAKTETPQVEEKEELSAKKEESEAPTKEKKATISPKDVPLDNGDSLLSSFYPPNKSSTISCLKSIFFSGWNPPPGYRKLAGDLIYLEATTLENKTYHITGWTKGFFVNATSLNSFNPIPAEKSFSYHSLVEVLIELSPSFKKNFQKLLQYAFHKHPFEMFPVPFPLHPWNFKKEKHTFDLNRAEDALLLTSETDMRGQLRDWNEEYQVCHELPHETIQERIIRDRALFKINTDFVEAATKGACAIIEGTVSPINPLDTKKAHMFIYNNIFFSYALDGRDFYKEFGGDKAAHVSANNDLKGIKMINRLDIKGLYTLATAIIDYRGYRVTAQSIIPGILQREQTSNVIYGSIDNGKTIANDDKFNSLVREAAKFLRIKEHVVLDQNNQPFKLATAVECKGIMGTDNRNYILDLVRLTPRDANLAGKENIFATLRPELVLAYYEHLKQVDLKKFEEEERKKKEEENKGKVSENSNENLVKDGKQEEKQESDEKSKKEEEEEKEFLISEEKLQQKEKEIEENFKGFNPNALCEYQLAGTPEEISQDESLVKEITSFLTEFMIPLFIEDASYFNPIPVDSTTLTTSMHNHGINMRYLGFIAVLADKIAVLKELTIREMVSRAAKHILREILRNCEEFNISNSISHFLNCLVGNIKSKDDKSKKRKESNINVFTLSSQSLWKLICTEVKIRFKYDLPEREKLSFVVRNVRTLRSLVQKLAIQLETKDYNFDAESPISVSDILNLFPLVKHCEPESIDGRNLLEGGKSCLIQGRLDIAYELLTEALAIFHQVYGPMHRDTATCYSNLGTVLYHAKDINQAIDHQQKSTVINERVLGIDHHDTAQSYISLALYNHSDNKPKQALTFMLRALYLVRLISGPSHPDTVNIQINIASILQEVGQFQSALHYYNHALSSYESLFGTNNLQVAGIYHAIALTHSQLGTFKEALIFEKKNYNILKERVGENDLRTVESNLCLKQFTAKAVQAQIETKKTQRDVTSQLSQLKLDKLRVQGKGESVHMGSRPLNEVLSFINGGGKGPKTFAERNKAAQLSEENRKRKGLKPEIPK